MIVFIIQSIQSEFVCPNKYKKYILKKLKRSKNLEEVKSFFENDLRKR